MISDQCMKFLTQGYIVMKNVLSPDQLQRAQEAFERGMAHSEDRDKDYYGIGNIFDLDEIFVELVNHPVTFPVVLESIGPDVQLEGCGGVVYQPGGNIFNWHRDTHGFLGINLEMSPRFRAKLHYFMDDVSEDGGCLGYVPGSQRYRPDDMPEVERMEDMPGFVRLPMKAGDALLIHIHGWHTVFPNTSDRPRKSLIYCYSHFWMKQSESGRPTHVEKYLDDPVRRQLFGVGDGGSYKGQRLSAE